MLYAFIILMLFRNRKYKIFILDKVTGERKSHAQSSMALYFRPSIQNTYNP